MVTYKEIVGKMKSIAELKRRIKSLRRINESIWSNLFNMNYLNNREHQLMIDNLNSMLMYIKSFMKLKNEVVDTKSENDEL